MQKGFPADELVYGQLSEYLSENNLDQKNNVFNAVVRRESQVELFDKLLEQHGTKLDKVIYLDLEIEEAVKRLMKRAEVASRVDDNPDTIAARIRDFKAGKQGVLDLYQQRGILEVINAVGTQEEVHQKVVEALGLIPDND